MSVNLDGPLCKCGNRGCLELYTSTNILLKHAQEKIADGVPSSLPLHCTKEDLFQAILNGDSLAVSLFQDALRYLGAGIVNIIYLYNPSIIVFGDEMVTYAMAIIIRTTAMSPGRNPVWQAVLRLPSAGRTETRARFSAAREDPAG